MRRSHSGPGPEPSAPDWCHHRRSHGQLSRFSQGPDPGRARSGRTRSGQQDRLRSRGNLSSARQGAGAHLVQRTSRRHHAGGRGRRDAHRRQSRDGRFRPPELSRGRQPRRLFRRWRVAKDRPARLQDHRRPGLHHRVRREVADRIGRHPEDALLLCRRRRTQGLREVVSDDRTRRDLRELHQPVRRRRVGRTSRAGAGVGALPELHLPRQPHADNRIRLRPPPRKSRRHRELSLRRQHRQPRSRLRRDAGRGGVSRRARIRRLDACSRARVRPSAGAPSPATGTASTTTAPEARTSTASSGRTRSPEVFQQGLVTSSISRMAPACAARSFTARSTTCAERSTKDRTRSIPRIRNSMPSSLRGRPDIRPSDTGL